MWWSPVYQFVLFRLCLVYYIWEIFPNSHKSFLIYFLLEALFYVLYYGLWSILNHLLHIVQGMDQSSFFVWTSSCWNTIHWAKWSRLLRFSLLFSLDSKSQQGGCDWSSCLWVCSSVLITSLCCWDTEVKWSLLSCVHLFATLWTIAYQAPLSMGFSRQECWSGLPFTSPGDLPEPGIEPGSPELQADTL